MKLRRRNRTLTVLVALFSLLFMQFAVAAYACPAVTGGPDLSVSAAMASMPECDQVDLDAPTLCHAHCQDVKFSLDKPDAPVVLPPVMVVSAILAPLEAVVSPLQERGRDAALLRITSPPISIRHCCFRI